MWLKSYSTTVLGIEPHQIWKIWSDIPKRPAWDDDTEWAKADGSFEKGTTITMKPKGWPKAVTMKIVECTPNQSFTDYTKFLLAELYGTHHMEKTDQGLKLTTSIKVVGPLSWVWRKIVAEEILATLPHQTDMLIKLARES
ncbi:MAG: polyketide cyclase [Proteobacteria bacterium]|nr:polyketide cyclase [Pseudomonadota bacterium]